jgi:hypothetical protein
MMRLRYWFCRRNCLLDGLRQQQDGSQEIRYSETFAGAGSGSGSNIESFEIRAENDPAGLRGHAQIVFVLVPQTPFQKADRKPKNHGSS